MLELLINEKDNVKTIMLVENGILVEKHEEHENQKRLEGNIYIGTVKDVLQGMQTAFVDIGEGKNTLLKLKYALPREQDLSNKNILDVLKPNMKIMVQIKKDGTITKGAKVSTHINLPGRFIVILPNADFITISQKIEDEKEKERLMKIAKKYIPQGIGAILRTSSENIEEEKIKEDIELLLERWNDIQKRTNKNNQRLLYDNNALIRRTVIDILDRGLEKITVNSKEIYQEISKILLEINSKTELIFNEDDNLFDKYSLKKQIEEIKNRKIWLKSGGFITIDKTEALTAIDVNTGKYTGKKDIEATIFKVNKEATYEIAKQLRLRDIGGIIIIDYIDMHEEDNKNKIRDLLVDLLKKDRTKTQVAGFTTLNLLEMTRKNMCNNEDEIFEKNEA